MNNNQNTYNTRPIGQMPMQGQLRQPLRNQPSGWRGQWMRRFGMDTAATPLRQGELTIPNWITGKAIAFFFVAMFACWFAFGYIPGVDLWLPASISVALFFYGGSSMLKSWNHVKEKRFIRNVFVTGLIVRLLWMLYMYLVFNPAHFSNAYGDSADVDWFIPFGKDLSLWITGESERSLSQLIDYYGSAIDDVAYPLWLGFIYTIVGVENDIFVPFLLKCIMGAYCAICLYRVAKRHYGEGVARMAAIFVALNPNMIYWCATMMKEAEMVFLVCVAVDNFDRVLSSGKRFTLANLLPGMIVAAILMFFRAVLGIVIFLAFFAHIVMASQRVMSMGKKILAGVLVAIVLVVSMGDNIRTQSRDLVEKVQSDIQGTSMEHRTNLKDAGGRQQSFAKYAGAAVFAPLIFTIPFPTFNEANVEQLTQMTLAGGSYIKNIFSFFVIIVMFMVLISGEWRRHVFILSYTLGYLFVLIMSPFAQSGRFHMPIWPMLMLFSAYGIQIAKTNARVRKWFPMVLVAEVAICLFWNWFKLKGRGMI